VKLQTTSLRCLHQNFFHYRSHTVSAQITHHSKNNFHESSNNLKIYAHKINLQT